MKKYIFLNIIISVLMFASCSDFLDENPNKSGNDPIQEVSQLDKLLNSIEFNKNAGEAGFSGIFASDDYDVPPELYKVHTALSTRAAFGVWDKDIYENSNSDRWESIWNTMFRINTIIEYAPKVRGSEKERKKMAAEAKFHRAFIHFLAIVEFCQHPLQDAGQNPGIGYRDNTDGEADKPRKTVQYTMERIIQDLTEAEAELSELGLNMYQIDRNWRITVPCVQAFRARVELYNAKTQADYDKAASFADKALKSYSKMINLETDPLFAVEEKSLIGKTKKWKELFFTKNTQNTGEYEECYFPFTIYMPSHYSKVCPVSKSLFDLYDEKDLRKSKFIENNYNYVSISGLPEDLVSNGLTEVDAHSFFKYGEMGFLLGPTVSEMHLIKAEAFARKGSAGQAVAELLTIRSNRFKAEDRNIADAIGGTLADVKNERRRELPFVLRWYDLKRYNQKANEQVTIVKRCFDDPLDMYSAIKTYTLAPNAETYALPIPTKELKLLSWEQNKYGGVTKQ